MCNAQLHQEKGSPVGDVVPMAKLDRPNKLLRSTHIAVSVPPSPPRTEQHVMRSPTVCHHQPQTYATQVSGI